MFNIKKALTKIMVWVKEKGDLIGNSNMGTSASTITGAIAEHESDISNLNSKIEIEAIAYSPFLIYGANGWTKSNEDLHAYRIGNLIFVGGTFYFTLSNPSSNYFEFSLPVPVHAGDGQVMVGFVTHSTLDILKNSFIFISTSGAAHNGLRFQKNGSSIKGTDIGTSQTRLDFKLIYLAANN